MARRASVRRRQRAVMQKPVRLHRKASNHKRAPATQVRCPLPRARKNSLRHRYAVARAKKRPRPKRTDARAKKRRFSLGLKRLNQTK